jgi:hypothetical protein
VSRTPASIKLTLHFSSSGDLGLVQDEQYVLRHRLNELEILIQIEVSDRCSDVQKLFPVIGNDGGNIMYKKSSDP